MSSNLLPPNWLDLSARDFARLAPLEQLHWPSIEGYGVTVFCKRDELLHPQLSGNKLYKLLGHLQQIRSLGASRIITFGGAYSNHLYAVAAAGQALGLETIGVVPGEAHMAETFPTLKDLLAMNMRLHFVRRGDYRQKTSEQWLSSLFDSVGAGYVIPEGGAGTLGAIGCVDWGREAVDLCPLKPDVCCMAVGTGTAIAGVSLGVGDVPVFGFSALKGRPEQYEAFYDGIENVRKDVVNRFFAVKKTTSPPAIHLETDYHCGGYAKFPLYLQEFTQQFERETGILLDPVYTAKMFWGIWQKVSSGYWGEGQTILALHSGGLQGRRGFACLA